MDQVDLYLCGRGCGHVIKTGETSMRSRRNGTVCLKCILPQDFLRVDPEDTHADEILDGEVPERPFCSNQIIERIKEHRR